MKVVIDEKIPYLRDALTAMGVDVVALPGDAIKNGDLLDADALFVRTRTRCNANLLAGTAVRCVGTAGVLEVRGGEILLCNGEGEQILRPTNAPELLAEFLDGGEAIPADEIFYLTRVALAARDAADSGREILIEA